MGKWLACVFVIAGAIGCGSPSRAPTDASETNSPDGAEQTGAFAAACSRHTDCESGYCVEPVGDTGGVCTRECSDDCPADWECRTVNLPQVDLQLCVPAAKQLCLACATDDECGGGACLTLDGVGRCATPCTDQCATGYECVPDASGTHTGNFCQPVTASCECSPELDGAMRSCSNANTIGTCFGTQVCSASTGWSTCTARTPATETCNGTDDDCNFIIDDELSGGGAACVKTNGFGSCPGITTCSGANGFECFAKTPAAELCNYLDDDCDNSVDEAYPGRGTVCVVGTGACARYGSLRCDSQSTGLACSAVGGTPAAESCNQIDDDCDAKTDENFKTGFLPAPANPIGAVCASGNGVCARYGTNVCRSDGAGTQCSATADMSSATTETCDYADNNCDGIVDNGFRDPNSGLYITDTNCGSCGTNCQTLYAGANAFGACQVGGTAVCVMRCNQGSGNLNGSTIDGCYFTLDPTAIYVSTTDATAIDDSTCGLGPTGTGTGNHPCKTITQGITRAVATGRAQVLVADGTYAEGVTLANGKHVLGGYRADTWERHLSTTSTVISGFTSSNQHDRTVVAASITSQTIFEGFVVRGSFNSKSGGNSYAIYVSGSNANLIIRNNQILGGRGGAGQQGAPGTPGAQGANGVGASGPNDNAYNAFTASGAGACATSNNRSYSNGGVRSCGAANVSGGNGGGNRCSPVSNLTEFSGIDGFNALGTGPGAGGDAGDDGILNSTGSCTVSSGPGGTPIVDFGVDGTGGSTGSSGSAVGGCTSSSGSVSSGDWVAGSGTAGNAGTHGAGGGGGGAGGGGYCNNCQGGKHRLGAHGGGGGSGGCGGAGGFGGGGGGGSFGIFVNGGTAPTISNNTITQGQGGLGGNGGIGGAGGLGGVGGKGGQTDMLCAGKAGRGGDGGNAGHGAGGGGGCGGSSFGIYTNGVGSPNYCAGNSVTGGVAGGGGVGGFSGGNSGGAGVAGVLQNCVSL